MTHFVALKLSFAFWLKSACSLHSADEWEALRRGRSLFYGKLQIGDRASCCSSWSAGSKDVGGWDGSTELVDTLLCALSFAGLQSDRLLPRDTLRCGREQEEKQGFPLQTDCSRSSLKGQEWWGRGGKAVPPESGQGVRAPLPFRKRASVTRLWVCGCWGCVCAFSP